MTSGSTLLRKYLRVNGQRPADLSRAAKIDQALLSRWLRDERRPGLEHACGLEKLTDGAVPACSWISTRAKRK